MRIRQKEKDVCLVRFYGISTFLGYLMQGPVYTYILDIYDFLKNDL